MKVANNRSQFLPQTWVGFGSFELVHTCKCIQHAGREACLPHGMLFFGAEGFAVLCTLYFVLSALPVVVQSTLSNRALHRSTEYYSQLETPE